MRTGAEQLEPAKAAFDAEPYSICRYIRHYHQKNGYAPTRKMLGFMGASPEYIDLLAKNGVVELLPLYEGGPKIGVVLTDKGARMADGRRR